MTQDWLRPVCELVLLLLDEDFVKVKGFIRREQIVDQVRHIQPILVGLLVGVVPLNGHIAIDRAQVV